MRPTLRATELLDRRSELRTDQEQIESLMAADGTKFFVLADGKPVITSNEDRTETHIRWFTHDHIKTLGLPLMDALFLGVEPNAGDAYFAIATSEHRVRHAAFEHKLTPEPLIVDLRSLSAQDNMDDTELSLLGQAAALANWHSNTRCCGHCGGSTSIKDAGWKRRCWSCASEFYPRMDPVVIMAVTDGERIVLGCQSAFPEKMYSTLAGYVEPGDDIEHAVRRETLEEIGLKVGRVDFIDAQPWPFHHALKLGCIAHVEPGELTVNKTELTDARWFERSEIEQMMNGTHPDGLWLPGRQAMAWVLINRILHGK